MRECANPVCGREAKRAGRCDPCYMWRRRHRGQERPEEAIIVNGYRQLVRELEVTSYASVLTRL